MFDNKILDAINYHARTPKKRIKFKRASLTTYAKKAIYYASIDIMRELRKRMPTASMDRILQSENDSQYQPHRRSTDIIRITSIAPQRTSTRYDHYLDLKLDVEMVMQRLSPRQKTLCRLLMQGMTQRQIADKMDLSQSRIQQLTQELRPFFKNV